MRTPSATDFPVPLDGVGDFTFARRTMGDLIKIRSTFNRLFGDAKADDHELDFFCTFVATYDALIVACPEGWGDILALDINAVGLDKVIELANLLVDKENSFRRKEKV